MADGPAEPTPLKSPWWDRGRHLDRRPFLLARNKIAAALRDFFARQDFVEVDPPCLQISPGNEAHLHAFQTQIVSTDGDRRRELWLHTSPEFACKKLLAAGEQRLFTLAHVFRNRERGPLHHPEFTMLEWYRASESYDVLIGDCTRILTAAARAAERPYLVMGDRRVDPTLPPERLTVAEAFERHAGIDLLATIAEAGTDRDGLARQAVAAGFRVADEDGWGDIFARILVGRVEAELGRDRATILDRYPISEAALARPAPDDGRVAQRFELYACGVELANAFGELTDPLQQRRRFEAEMAEMRRVYGYSYPIDEDFLRALDAMPAASGIALGFDRLVMLATGATRIEQVLWAPVVETETADQSNA